MTRASLADSNGLRTTTGEAYKGLGSKKHLLKRFTDLTGFVVDASGTAELATINGETFVKITTVAGTQTEVEFSGYSIPAPIGPHMVWAYYLDDYTTISSVQIFAGPTAYPANISLTATFTGSSAFDRNGYGVMAMNPYSSSISGSGFNWNTGTLQDFKFRITPKVGEVAVVYLHSAFLLARQRSTAIIGFDDNYSSVSQTGAASVTLKGVSGTYTFKDILDAFDYKGTLWMVTGYLTGEAASSSTGLTWAQLQELVTAGWDAQVQTHYNPVSASNKGNKLLGPTGYADKTIASINTTSNVLTAGAAHDIPAGGSFSFPILFTGTDLPTGISTETIYYARYESSTTTFTLHPTAADSVAGTNIIDFTDEGTVANYAWHYARATNDASGSAADFAECKAQILSNLGITPRFIAYNQGAVDGYIEDAARSNGLLIARTTYQSMFKNSSMFDHDTESDIYPHEHLWTVALDEATARTVAYYIALIATPVKLGHCIHSYMHGGSTTANQNLVNFCEALEYYNSLGMLSVKTMSRYYDDRFVARN